VVLFLVTRSAQAFEPAVPELHPITTMVLNVMDDGCQPHKVDGEAPFAQGLVSQLTLPEPTPTFVVVWAASSVAASAAAAGMQAGKGIGTHGD
jgi:hypothetical protein